MQARKLSEITVLPHWIEDMELDQAYALLSGDFGHSASEYFKLAGYSATELLTDYGTDMIHFLAGLFADRSETPLIGELWVKWDGLSWSELCERIAFKAIYLKLGLLLTK